MKLKGLIDKTAYRLSRHYLGEWTLLRWLILLLLIAPTLSLVKAVFQTPAWGWSELGSASLFSVTLFLIVWQSKRRGYMRFHVAPPPSISPNELPYLEKITIRASGNFRIKGITRYFVEENALYQTFATKERAIMVNISFTRFMLLSHSPEAEIGWWYSFFSPETLSDYQTGTLTFGATPRPALQLRYRLDKDSNKIETLYLSFDSLQDLAIVLADLQADKMI
ncbi:MAG TPA: hypothetical protein G4N96_06125 [Chloroflexi bacterium]|nr:MAG: hypothetical protein B6243_07250 [Anaerolineaceae bacterium 4572_5.2]HEY84671.1 hypothetical protein [Chloroflexota bacterium]